MFGTISDWVQNLEARRGAAVLAHGRCEDVRLVPVAPDDRAPILREYVRVASSGRKHFPLGVGAPLADFEAIAAQYPVYRVDARDAHAESVDLDAGADAVRAHLERLAHALPGLQYAITDAKTTRFEFCGGLADVGARRPVDGHTQFMTASCTKVVTAAAVQMLVERGRVVLEHGLSEYFVEHPYGRDVTVGQLLAHTAGVPNPLPIDWLHRIEDDFDEDKALAAVLRAHPKLRFAPGTRYAYSNLGYWLLGKVIERASGTSYVRFVEDAVLAPVAIAQNELGFAVSDITRLARGYERAWSPSGLFVRIAVRNSLLDGRDGPWLRFARVSMNGPAYGGLFGTARGFCAFLRAQLASPPSEALGWRTGTVAGVTCFGKPGGGPGFCGNVRVYPSAGIATAWFANRMAISERRLLELTDAMDVGWFTGADGPRAR